MSLRPPQGVAKLVNPETGLSMVQAEVLAETAASLGQQGKRVEAALAQLANADDENRAALTSKVARAVWEYFIQRELCGMRDHRWITREMGIPQSVLNMMGAVGR